MGGNDSPTPLKQADTPATAASTVEDAEEVLEPVLQKLAPREQEVVRHALAVSYRGPLPPSVEMGGYNREIPNGGDRIVSSGRARVPTVAKWKSWLCVDSCREFRVANGWPSFWSSSHSPVGHFWP